jgi:alpha-galactosidase
LSVTKHPDWFIAPPKLDLNGEINWDALIDLGYDPARDWAEQATQRAVSEYSIDYFKTDYTPIVTHCEQTDHRHHYGVDVSYWSTLGYYAVQEALMRKFPDLMMEGCSGSGHIKDFGDIQRAHVIAMNDTLSSLPNRQGTYDSTFALPPAALMNYAYENYYDTVSDAPELYFWRSSMMNAWLIDPTAQPGRGNSGMRSNEPRKSTNHGSDPSCWTWKCITFCLGPTATTGMACSTAVLA